MKIIAFTIGLLETNCYVLFDEETKSALVIDPGDESEKILKFLKENSLKLDKIILTHGHPDHTMGVKALVKSNKAKVYAHQDEVFFNDCPVDVKLKEGDLVKIGDIELKVLHTPGHTPGGISLVGKDFVFTGDTLFNQGVGRVDLPGGSEEDLIKSLKRLMDLQDNFKIYPGHGEASTIGEQRNNSSRGLEKIQ